MEIPWALISILVTIIILGVLVAYKIKTGSFQKRQDYRTFFNIGLVWVPFGIVMMVIFENSFMGLFFFIFGLAYLGIGLANKDKWGKVSKRTKKEEKYAMIAGILILISVIVGLTVFMFLN